MDLCVPFLFHQHRAPGPVDRYCEAGPPFRRDGLVRQSPSCASELKPLHHWSRDYGIQRDESLWTTRHELISCASELKTLHGWLRYNVIQPRVYSLHEPRRIASSFLRQRATGGSRPEAESGPLKEAAVR